MRDAFKDYFNNEGFFFKLDTFLFFDSRLACFLAKDCRFTQEVPTSFPVFRGTHLQFQKQPVNEVSVYRMSEITILVFWMSIHSSQHPGKPMFLNARY